MTNVLRRVSELGSDLSKSNQQITESFSVLFVSFDLVNSTAFKARVDNWHVVIHYFYDLVVKEVQSKCRDIKVWKYVGDEVLLFKAISDIDELAADAKHVFHACRSVSTSIQNSFEPTRRFLSVKATAWIARVVKIPSQDIEELRRKWLSGEQSGDHIESTNILVMLQNNDSSQSIDFLGSDVDAGFRIARFSHNEKLVVSAELAYILAKHARPTQLKRENLRVIAWEKLKGIWQDRYYPIIWYFEDWDRIDGPFSYDEERRVPLVAQIKGKNIPSNIDALDHVFDDLGRQPVIEKLIASARQNLIETEQSIVSVPRGRLAEVHCVAICVTREGKILIAQRHPGKKTLPGAWEFGCSQLKIGEDFKDAIIAGYKEDFAAAIEQVSLLPIAKYVIEGDRKIPGLIFAALVSNEGEIEAHYSKEKHTNVRWINESEAKAMSKDNVVPDFAENISLALAEARRQWIRDE